METPCWCPSGWAPTWRPGTNKNICHWSLLQKHKFISRGTPKHWNNNFSIKRTVQIAKFPEIKVVTHEGTSPCDQSLQLFPWRVYTKGLVAETCPTNRKRFEEVKKLCFLSPMHFNVDKCRRDLSHKQEAFWGTSRRDLPQKCKPVCIRGT